MVDVCCAAPLSAKLSSYFKLTFFDHEVHSQFFVANCQEKISTKHDSSDECSKNSDSLKHTGKFSVLCIAGVCFVFAGVWAMVIDLSIRLTHNHLSAFFLLVVASPTISSKISKSGKKSSSPTANGGQSAGSGSSKHLKKNVDSLSKSRSPATNGGRSVNSSSKSRLPTTNGG